MLNESEPTEKSNLTERSILFVKDQESANSLNEFLGKGWKLDPFLPVTRLDTGAIYPLLKPGDDLLQCDPNIKIEEEAKPTEFSDVIDFVSLEPDKAPGGAIAKLVEAGWTAHGFAAAKNLVQMKLLRKKEEQKQ